MLYQVTSTGKRKSFKQMVLGQLDKLLYVFQLHQAIKWILTLSIPGSVLGVDSVIASDLTGKELNPTRLLLLQTPITGPGYYLCFWTDWL